MLNLEAKIENLQNGLANIRDYIKRCEMANAEAGYEAWDTSFWKKQELEAVIALHDAICELNGADEFKTSEAFKAYALA